jgi:hypothetical protein
MLHTGRFNITEDGETELKMVEPKEASGTMYGRKIAVRLLRTKCACGRYHYGTNFLHLLDQIGLLQQCFACHYDLRPRYNRR